MLKLFLGRNVGGQLLVLTILYVAAMFLLPSSALFPLQYFGPLYEPLYGVMEGNVVLIDVLTKILIALLMVAVSFVLQAYELSSRQSFAGSLFFLMMVLAFPGVLTFGPALLCVILFLILLKRIFDLEESQRTDGVLFGVSFFAGVGSMIYFPAFLLLPLLLLALVYMQLFRFRYVVLVLIHFMLPYFFLFTWAFLSDQLPEMWTAFLSSFAFSSFVTFPSLDSLSLGRWIFLSVFVLMIMFRQLTVVMNQLIHIRRYSMLVFWSLLMGVLSLLWPRELAEADLLVLFIPLSMTAAFLMKDQKRTRVLNIVVIVLLVLEYAHLIYQKFYVATQVPG